MNQYRVLKNQVFKHGEYSIVPIRMEDRYDIMRWRNEQMYHLRQNKPLSSEDQDRYFDEVVAKLVDQEKPDQVLFSYLEGDKCIGYGGLVHINWIDRNAEISFLIDTTIEQKFFVFHWTTFLSLIEKVAFCELEIHKIFTYAFDLRKNLYEALFKAGYNKEAILKEHAVFEERFLDVVVHSKIAGSAILRNANQFDVEQTFKWVNDPVIRKYSFTKDQVDFLHHKSWFLEKLENNACEYYLLEKNKTALGSIRFDRVENGNYLVSFLIDPAYSGRGFGYKILKDGVDRLSSARNDANLIYGYVHFENIASIRIFEKLNYTKKIHKKNVLVFRKFLK